jgi:hypothetical protein
VQKPDVLLVDGCTDRDGFVWSSWGGSRGGLWLTQDDRERGRHMGRVSGALALSAFGLALVGCSSGSVNGLFPGMASSNPAKTTIQLQSEPAGAEAKTSLGSSCHTPCSLELAANNDLSVTFSLDGYQPQTIPVKPAPPTGPAEPGTYPTVALTPNPVMAQLEPITPAVKKRAKPRKHVAAAKPKPPAAQPTQPETPSPPQSPQSQ